MRIEALYTSGLKDVYAQIKFRDASTGIRNLDGSLAHEQVVVVAPASWSQIAIDVVAKKYLRRAGVPSRLTKLPEPGVPVWLQRSVADLDGLALLPESERYGPERDLRHLFDRIAGATTYWGWKGGYFTSEPDARNFYDEIRFMLATQKAAPNSPQWFNTGLHWAYGIEGPKQGHYVVDGEGEIATEASNAFGRPQTHSCFIQSVEDDLVNPGGILAHFVDEARIAKYGSGTGANFSQIRGAGENLSGGGRACGLIAVLRAGDRAAGLVTAHGSTRRASKMVIVDVDHPDIEDFIDWKAREEQKVAALVTGSKICARYLSAIMKACLRHGGAHNLDPDVNVELRQAIRAARRSLVPESYIRRAIDLAGQGYLRIDFPVLDVDWDAEAYLTVAGQNGNNTVRVSDAFLQAVERNTSWDLTARTDGRVMKSLAARDLWEKIGTAAWASADPGIHFSTTINDWHTCPSSGPILASNSCSEYLFLDNTGATLASLNLLHFLRDDKTIDLDLYEHACRLWTVALEISVSMAQYPSAAIARRTARYRPLGLGYANLGGFLMTLGRPYDCGGSRALCGALTAIMTGVVYATSARIASELGPFLGFHANRDAMLRVIRNHRRAVHGGPGDYEGVSSPPPQLDAAALGALGVEGVRLGERARSAWDSALSLGERHGYRNAQATVIAPTGTIGLVMDCDTTGIEPDFALVKFKKLSSGGYFKIINRAVPEALRTLGYNRSEIAAIEAYAVGRHSLSDAPAVNRRALRLYGFTDEKIDVVEAALASAFDIKFAFSKWIVGEDFLTDVLKVPVEKLDQPSFDLLAHLGFSKDEIERANIHVCGAMTLEGAPYLRAEHLPVFDCANPCGRTGTRALSVASHIRMMAAAQPFISGAISKTINLPNTATVEECKAAYLLSWRLGLKANAIYREGSKLSQPLNAQLIAEEEDEDALEDFVQQPPASRVRIVAETVADRILEESGRSSKARFANASKSVKHVAIVGGARVSFQVRNDDDGRPVELSINAGDADSERYQIANDVAVAVSLGLQNGVPLETFVSAFAAPDWAQRHMMPPRRDGQTSSRMIDHVFRQLAIDYLGRHDLQQDVAI